MAYTFANAANAAQNLQATYKGVMTNKAAAAAYIKKLWSDSLRRELDEVSQDLKSYIWVDSFGLGYSGGDTYNVRTIGNLGINNVVEGTPVTLQTTAMSSFPITLDRYIESSFSISDLTKMLNDQGLIENAFLERARFAMYKHVMGTVLGMRAAFNAVAGSTIFATTTGLAGGESRPLDLNHILDAITRLRSRNFDNNMVLLVTSVKFAQLLANQRIQNVFIKGGVDGAAVSDGVVGSIFGVPVRVTNFATANSATGWLNGTTATPTPGVVSSLFQPTQEPIAPVALPTTWAVAQAVPGGAEVHTAMLVHKEAVAMANPFSPTSSMDYEQLYLMYACVNSYLYGMRSYRQTGAIVINTNGSIPAMTTQF